MNNIAAQVMIETRFDQNQVYKRLIPEFKTCEKLTKIANDNQLPEWIWKAIVDISLAKRKDITAVIGMIRHHFTNCQDAADFVMKCVELDIWDYEPGRTQIISKYFIDDELKQTIDRWQYPLPMIIEPEYIDKNNKSGYLTRENESVLLNSYHNSDICLDHINRVNQVAYSLNMDVTKLVKNQWRNINSKKKGESYEEYQDRVKAYKKFTTDSMFVMEFMLKFGNNFWFTHAYDKRGRTYNKGYHITYQGNDFGKAVIEFAKQELIED